MEEKTIRILVVDDNEMMRHGLCETISVEPNFDVVGSAGNSADALRLCSQLHPDVLTMDYQMPGDNGLECTQKLLEKDPDAKVILISIFDSEEDIWNAVQAGVKGYLTKRSGDVKVLADAIQTVADGGLYFPSAIARKLQRRKDTRSLTARETQVLKLMADGKSNKKISSELDISEATVKFHVIHIREKLHAGDRTEAVAKGFRQGILRVSDEPL